MRYSPAVILAATAEGIALPELDYMVEHAALSSLPGGNRRYHDWLFFVDNGVVETMKTAAPVTVGHGAQHMTEDCDECQGSGCKACGHWGTITRKFS